ncbi:MAG: aminotransferase class V-fold PLP-dependent enzyme [Rhodospirillaceae bacterium]|nr:aminotransferase class V-fold PLP-dependent enzyme [Rhodospirillaceae bacterium]MDD9998261.1 aminotransferase class V-fold PLP-dependent enzyme [Rhodospirillaceae bacterium]MDE0361936.1 aminotransferase class V-fold PLP-dependent enzyme [Rhodospirillaceae bacterium]
MLPRREVLKSLAGGAALGALGGNWLSAAAQEAAGEEAFWEQVKAQFPIRPGLTMMNSANLCPTHYPVLERLFGLTRDLDGDVSFQNRAKFAGTKDEARSRLAGYVGAEPEEIAITRNTTEANNLVINGLDLAAGDEVLVWGENHESNLMAWEVRARRSGFSVNRVETPPEPLSAEVLRDRFLGMLTPRTRVLAVSHVSNISGIGLPMKSLCEACRDRNILTLVDGAQTLGALDLDLHDMGCDFFTGSLHKWPMGPKETGLLYVRRGSADHVWPSVVGVGYDDAENKGALKLETLGQRDDPAIAAIVPAMDFLESIGKARIEARLRAIVARLRRGIEAIPGVSILTPPDPAINAGILIFSLPGITGSDAFEALYREHDIGSARAGLVDGVRLSPHIYNTLADADRVVDALKAIAA